MKCSSATQDCPSAHTHTCFPLPCLRLPFLRYLSFRFRVTLPPLPCPPPSSFILPLFHCGIFAVVQVCCHAPAPWAAGGLLLLSEVLKSHQGLWAALQQPEDTAAAATEVFRDAPDDAPPSAAAAAAAAAAGSESEEEVFRDADDSKDEAAAGGGGGTKKQKQQQKQQQGTEANGVSAATAAAAAAAAAGGGKWPKEGCYDMRKR